MSRDVMFERGNYRVIHVEYLCHPETCCHDDHPPYVIQQKKFGQWRWMADENDFPSATQRVTMFADKEKLDIILADRPD